MLTGLKVFSYYSRPWGPEKINTKGNLDIKDFVRSLANPLTFIYMKLLWGKKMTGVTNLFKHYDVPLYFAPANSHRQKPYEFKLWGNPFFFHNSLQLHEICHPGIKLNGCVLVLLCCCDKTLRLSQFKKELVLGSRGIPKYHESGMEASVKHGS